MHAMRIYQIGSFLLFSLGGNNIAQMLMSPPQAMYFTIDQLVDVRTVQYWDSFTQ